MYVLTRVHTCDVIIYNTNIDLHLQMNNIAHLPYSMLASCGYTL